MEAVERLLFNGIQSDGRDETVIDALDYPFDVLSRAAEAYLSLGKGASVRAD
jgi:hypothetical protein